MRSLLVNVFPRAHVCLPRYDHTTSCDGYAACASTRTICVPAASDERYTLRELRYQEGASDSVSKFQSLRTLSDDAASESQRRTKGKALSLFTCIATRQLAPCLAWPFRPSVVRTPGARPRAASCRAVISPRGVHTPTPAFILCIIFFITIHYDSTYYFRVVSYVCLCYRPPCPFT